MKRNNVANGGTETGQGPSRLPGAGKQAHVDEEHAFPDAVNVKDLEPDDIVIAYVINISMVKV